MAESSIHKHSSLYLADGNICLAAPQTQTIENHDTDTLRWIVFRVHQTMLSMHSPVFADMLALQPTVQAGNMDTDIDKFEGVSLVRMPDSAEDLEAMLKALYFGWCATPPSIVPPYATYLPLSKLPHPRLHPDTPLTLKPLLSIAKKYQISSIRHTILSRLESDFPQSLLAWDRLEAEVATTLQAQQNDILDSSQYVDDHFPEPCAAIRLARDCDEPTILPAAFYALARIRIEEDRGRRDADEIDLERFEATRTARWELLTAEDFTCLLRGQSKLRQLISEYHERFNCTETLSSGNTCQIREKVRLHCAVVSRQLELEPGVAVTDPLAFFKAFWVGFDVYRLIGRGEVCDGCQDRVYYQKRSTREDIWDGLGEYFELGRIGGSR